MRQAGGRGAGDPGEAGFTLIELIVSLALFGLISIAGLALVDSVLGVQAQTDGRLDRLADLQRMMYVVTVDLEQLASGPLAGGGGHIAFTRQAPAIGGFPMAVDYDGTGGALMRRLGPGQAQTLLGGATDVRWRFHDGAAGWTDRWPPADATRQGDWPDAVELTLTLVGGKGKPSGTLRRVVTLPARAA